MTSSTVPRTTMFGHCLFCSAALGANATVEHCPIGRQLAFDAAKGRLWVVCPVCARWNLTPFEERWEAIETCERAFRATPLRACTENIGLARLGDGLELVRIGAAMRPELAVWRYGRQLRKRYFRAARGWTLAAMGTGGVTGAMLAGLLSPFAAVTSVAMGAALLHFVRRELVVDRIFGNAGIRYSIRRGDVPDARVIANDDGNGWTLFIEHAWGTTHVEGDAAHAALSRLLVHLNRRGASEHSVSRALARLETASSAEEFIASVARRADHALAQEAEELRRRDWSRAVSVEDARATLGDLDFYYRVALEMAVHESMERQALEGELRVLEVAWREAEHVAAIADDLLLPSWIREYVRRESQPGARGAK